MKLGGVHHLALVVRDLAAMTRFYADGLGLAVVRRWDDAAGAPRAVWLALDDHAFLALERPASAETRGRRADGDEGWHAVALSIAREEREAVRARLRVIGAPVERESPYTLYARDPEGNLVAFSHYPDAAP